MPVSQKDIAERAGVSQFVVSNALSNRQDTRIAPETQQKVRDIARQMGYVPNRSARALVTGRTHLVAMLVYRLSSPYVGMVSQQMQDVVHQDGYELLMREYGGGDLTLQSSVDGILALDAGHVPHGEVPEDSTKPAVPCVLIGTYHSKPTPLDRVDVDLEDVAREATEHLIRSGRRRIAHVTSKANSPGDTRCEGYRAALAAAGLPETFLNVPGDQRADGFSAIEQCVAAGKVPDALFCRNDELATGCLRALHDLGRRVPEDIAVMGCDAIEEGEYLQPRLSTIVLPVAEMCRVAWQFLRRRMAEPGIPQQTATLRSSLLLRESDGANYLMADNHA